MRRMTTILCSLLFAVFGVGLGLSGLDSMELSKTQTLSAATIQLPQDFGFNQNAAVVDYSTMPLDLQLDQAKKASVDADITAAETESAKIDSLTKVIAKLEQTKQVTKVKWRTGPAPPPIVKTKVVEKTMRDTIRIPVYYLATQVEKKEDSNGKCIPVYEVRQVDEICPTTNSSNGYVNEHVSDTGD